MKHVIGLNLILGGWLLLLPFAFGYLTVAMWNDVVLGLDDHHVFVVRCEGDTWTDALGYLPDRFAAPWLCLRHSC